MRDVSDEVLRLPPTLDVASLQLVPRDGCFATFDGAVAPPLGLLRIGCLLPKQ